MEVSGLGGVGMAGGAGLTAGASSPSSSTSATSPAAADAIAKSAPAPQSIAEYYAGAQSPNLQEVVNQLKEFSMAELLIALMILAAGNQEDKEKSGGSSALGFLAGVSIANHLSQPNPLLQPISSQAISPSSAPGQIVDISI